MKQAKNNNTYLAFSWPFALCLFALSFFGSWLFFGTLYYFISWHHGDFEPEHLPGNQSASGIRHLTLHRVFNRLDVLVSFGYGSLFNTVGKAPFELNRHVTQLLASVVLSIWA